MSWSNRICRLTWACTMHKSHFFTCPVSILYKSIAGRYRPVRVADGPITARYRFIKNASWVVLAVTQNEYNIFTTYCAINSLSCKSITGKHNEKRIIIITDHNDCFLVLYAPPLQSIISVKICLSWTYTHKKQKFWALSDISCEQVRIHSVYY